MPKPQNIGMSIEAVKGSRLTRDRVAVRLGLWEKRTKLVQRQMPLAGFAESQVAEALAECQKMISFYEEVLDTHKRRRVPAGSRPAWAPVPVDVDLCRVRPLPGWVVLEEIYTNKEHLVPGTDAVIHIHRPYECNTVYGRVRAAQPDTLGKLTARLGDVVVYREYSGGRWAFLGVKVIIAPATDILAVVDETHLR